LSIATDEPEYVATQTVFIEGRGFSAFSNITLRIINSSNDAINSTNTTSNSTGSVNVSWAIPAGTGVGTYTANLTDVNDTSRSVKTTFDIVTAIIEANQTSFEQGQSGRITGRFWDNNVNVTINITDAAGNLLDGPRNTTTNATGFINDTLLVDFNWTPGIYTLSAFQPSNPDINDYFIFNVTKRIVNLTTDSSWYKKGFAVSITGTGFSPNATVIVHILNGSLDIINSTNVTANATGGINATWQIPLAQNIGNYTANATDLNYTNLWNSTNFTINAPTVLTDRKSYTNGDIVFITGSYWYPDVNVTVRVINSSGGFVLEQNATTNLTGDFNLTWVAEAPQLGINYYNLTAFQHNNTGENDTVNFSVLRKATLNTDKSSYDQNEIVNLTGSFYNAEGDVNITIVSLANNGMAFGFPKTVVADSSGDISLLWNTTDACEGNYSARSIDLTFPDHLSANKSFNISYDISKNSSLPPNESALSGNSNINSGSYSDAAASDDVWQLFGGEDISADLNAFINYTFNLSLHNITKNDTLLSMTLFVEYCHSGDTVAPIVCNSGSNAHEGTTRGNQDIEMYNFTANSWEKIGNLSVNENNDNEQQLAIYLNATTLEDFIDNGLVYVRLEMNFTQSETEDDVLMVDFINLNISYIKDIDKPCTMFDVDAPNVTYIRPLAGTKFNVSESINFSAKIVDDRNVSAAIALVVYPNSTRVRVAMNDEDDDDFYNATFASSALLGRYNVTIYANDSWGNSNSSETTFFTVVDEVPPSAVVTHPLNGHNSSTDYILFNFTAIDNFFINLTCNITIDGVVNVSNINVTNGTYANRTVSNLGEGTHTWNISCKDSNNNTNTSAAREFIVIKGPAVVNATLADDNESIVLDWNDVGYADSYNIYIIDSFSDEFGPTPDVSGLTDSNYTDSSAGDKRTRFYKIAAVRGSANKTTIKIVGKYKVELVNNTNSATDWNLISLPLNITNFELNNGTNNGYDLPVKPLYCIKSLWYYNSTTGEFKRTDYNGSAWIPAAGSENFTSLESGRGYWAEVNQSCNLTFVGEIPTTNLTIRLDEGWNLVGWYSSNSSNLPMTSAATGWSQPEPPYYPVNVNPSGAVRAIDRYNSITDRFEVTLHYGGNWGWWPSSNNPDFTALEPTRGYYFDVAPAATWEHKPNTNKD
jgi:hypothetical protein